MRMRPPLISARERAYSTALGRSFSPLTMFPTVVAKTSAARAEPAMMRVASVFPKLRELPIFLEDVASPTGVDQCGPVGVAPQEYVTSVLDDDFIGDREHPGPDELGLRTGHARHRPDPGGARDVHHPAYHLVIRREIDRNEGGEERGELFYCFLELSPVF